MTGNRGFTLLEVLFAAIIFAVALGAILSLFVVSLRGQRNVIAQQNLVYNTRFALEHMARQIRMAQRDETGGGDCTGTTDTFYSSGGSSLSFLDYKGVCVTYNLSGVKIQAESAGQFLDLTSNDINVNILDFSVQGRTKSNDNEQPRVTIFIEAEDVSNSSVKIQLQTTVSARNLDVP